jgi:hypothetical protein
MNTSMILRALANGVNPDTGELLNRSSFNDNQYEKARKTRALEHMTDNYSMF